VTIAPFRTRALTKAHVRGEAAFLRFLSVTGFHRVAQPTASWRDRAEEGNAKNPLDKSARQRSSALLEQVREDLR
jgi:hypothetical protein